MISSSIYDPPLAMHANYSRLVNAARQSHEQNRSPEGIGAAEIDLARLYCYAFRLHTIGAFHASRLALEQCEISHSAVEALRIRAVEALADLGNQAMEDVPHDFRVVVTTFYRYDQGIRRVLDSVDRIDQIAPHLKVQTVGKNFRDIMQGITAACGIHLTQDLSAPEQASFVVPNLGITIVPLVYGDHHSWNLAFLGGSERNVPTHRHYHGVELHLGYEPTHGMTLLGDCCARVDEGYAMPIPPKTDHGWINTSDAIHHVPFVFGSLVHGGWGVFLDVEAQPKPIDELRQVDRASSNFSQMVYLEREIQSIARVKSCLRKTLIPFSVTNREGSGGLELSLTRINPLGFDYPLDSFRTLSIARGTGRVSINGVERDVRQHDHFGVPAGMKAVLRQTGSDPLIVLDALIKGYT